MKRRNFLKLLSSIPLIGIPVKAFAKIPDITMKNGSAITFTESSGDGDRIKWRRVEDWNQVIASDELETDFCKITLNRGVSWLD